MSQALTDQHTLTENRFALMIVIKGTNNKALAKMLFLCVHKV